MSSRADFASLCAAMRGAGGTASAPQASDDDFAEEVQAAPSPTTRFASAVRDFASWSELDADALLSGQTFEIGGIGFTFLHYGILDPAGATVVIDFGEFPPHNEAQLLRLLLEHNLRTPAGLHGYFALAPELNRMQYCIRVDLDRAEDGADAIGTIVTLAVHSMQGMCESIVRQLDAMHGKSAAADSPKA